MDDLIPTQKHRAYQILIVHPTAIYGRTEMKPLGMVSGPMGKIRHVADWSHAPRDAVLAADVSLVSA